MDKREIIVRLMSGAFSNKYFAGHDNSNKEDEWIKQASRIADKIIAQTPYICSKQMD